jgi:hypothetical protein
MRMSTETTSERYAQLDAGEHEAGRCAGCCVNRWGVEGGKQVVNSSDMVVAEVMSWPQVAQLAVFDELLANDDRQPTWFAGLRLGDEGSLRSAVEVAH